MASSLQLRPFASTYSHPLPHQIVLADGVTALLRQRYFDHVSFNLPPFDEHMLLVHLKHKLQVSLRLDREYEFFSVPGDTTIVPRGQATEWHIAGSADVLLLAIPQGAFAQPRQQTGAGSFATCELLPRAGYADPLIYGIGRAIADHLACADPPVQDYLDALLRALLAHLVCRHALAVPPAGRLPGMLAPEILRRVTEYIDSKLDGELSLSAIADLAQYSPYHFARCFRNSTGEPLHKYVLGRRLICARRMLETTNLAIGEIAQLTGFTDHSHLTSHFRRAYHITPGQYRLQLAASARFL